MFEGRLSKVGLGPKSNSFKELSMENEQEERIIHNTFLNGLTAFKSDNNINNINNDSIYNKYKDDINSYINEKKSRNPNNNSRRICWADNNNINRKDLLCSTNHSKDLFYQKDIKPVLNHRKGKPIKPILKKSPQITDFSPAKPSKQYNVNNLSTNGNNNSLVNYNTGSKTKNNNSNSFINNSSNLDIKTNLLENSNINNISNLSAVNSIGNPNKNPNNPSNFNRSNINNNNNNHLESKSPLGNNNSSINNSSLLTKNNNNNNARQNSSNNQNTYNSRLSNNTNNNKENNNSNSIMDQAGGMRQNYFMSNNNSGTNNMTNQRSYSLDQKNDNNNRYGHANNSIGANNPEETTKIIITPNIQSIYNHNINNYYIQSSNDLNLEKLGIVNNFSTNGNKNNSNNNLYNNQVPDQRPTSVPRKENNNYSISNSNNISPLNAQGNTFNYSTSLLRGNNALNIHNLQAGLNSINNNNNSNSNNKLVKSLENQRLLSNNYLNPNNINEYIIITKLILK